MFTICNKVEIYVAVNFFYFRQFLFFPCFKFISILTTPKNNLKQPLNLVLRLIYYWQKIRDTRTLSPGSYGVVLEPVRLVSLAISA